MRQVGKCVKTLGLASECFGQHLARQVGVGHAMAAATLGVIDVVAQATHLWQA